MSWRSCQGYSSWEEWWMCWVRFWDQVCWAHRGGGFSGLGSACCRASFLLLLFFDNFIYYFLAVRVLRCCQGFPSMRRAGALVWHGLLIAWPLSAEHRHGLGLVGFITAARGLSRRGSRLWSTGSVGVVHSLSCFSALGPPGWGVEPVPPASSRGFFTTEPPGKPLVLFLMLAFPFFPEGRIIENTPFLFWYGVKSNSYFYLNFNKVC